MKASFAARSCGLLLLLLCSLPLLAFGPEEALRYRSPLAQAQEDRVTAAKTRWQAAARGLDSLLTANQTSGTKGYSISLRYTRDIVTVAESVRSIDQAELDLRQATRDGIRLALLAHGVLWEAQAQETAARTRREYARLAKAEYERKRELGGVADVDVEIAAIDLADAELALTRAGNVLVAAQAQAKRYDLAGEAEAKTLQFTLPAANLDQLPRFRDLEWEVRLAETRWKAAKRDIRPAFGVEVGNYGAETQLSVGITTRGPDANVQVGYPSLYDPSSVFYGSGWHTIFRIEFPVNPAGKAAVRLADAEREVARTRLAMECRALEIDLPQAQADVKTAEDGLSLARQRLALAKRRHEAMLKKAEAGAVSELAMLQDDAAAAEADAALAGAWKRYLEAVSAYLTLVDGKWEVAP